MAIFFERRKYYFRGFPIVNYQLDGMEPEVLNFIHRWAFRKTVKDNAAAYSKWIIRDQDTIFSISQTLYGSQHYYWIILMMNDMINPVFDWPMDDFILNNFIIAKYGSEHIHDLHHYEAGVDSSVYSYPVGTIVDENYGYVAPWDASNREELSNWDYEVALNLERRYVKLLQPDYLSKINREREEIIASAFKTIRR